MIVEPRASCKGCDRRHPGCHSECKDYLSFAARRREWLEKKHRETAVDEVTIDGIKKSVKRQNRDSRQIWGGLR